MVLSIVRIHIHLRLPSATGGGDATVLGFWVRPSAAADHADGA